MLINNFTLPDIQFWHCFPEPKMFTYLLANTNRKDPHEKSWEETKWKDRSGKGVGKSGESKRGGGQS